MMISVDEVERFAALLTPALDDDEFWWKQASDRFHTIALLATCEPGCEDAFALAQYFRDTCHSYGHHKLKEKYK